MLALGLILGLVALGSCWVARSPAGANPVSSPGAFKDDFDATIAASGDSLWLAKTGLDRKDKVRTQTLSFRNGRWKALPGKPRSTTDTALKITPYRAPGHPRPGPCVADVAPGGIARVRCFAGGKWSSKVIPERWRQSYPQGLAVHRGRLLLTMQRVRRQGPEAESTIQAFLLRGTRFRELGRPVKFDTLVLANLATRTSGTHRPRVEIGITGTSDPAFRTVITLKKGRWVRSRRTPRMVGGSSTSGPVRSGQRTYLAVNQSDWSKPYEFSVWAGTPGKPWREVGGRPLNQGFGQAQGGVFPVGRSVWAIWSEFNVEGSEFGGWFPVETFAAKLKPGGSGFARPLRLWKGQLVFPVPEEMVSLKGRPVFLYMRQFTRQGGMHATIDFRSPAEIRRQSPVG